MRYDPQERAARARNLFLEGYNCTQSVVLAYADLFPGLSADRLAALAAPHGGGVERLYEVCGAVSGMALVAGAVCPNPRPKDQPAKAACYALVQDLAHAFRQSNGTIVCRELLGLAERHSSPEPSERTSEYYRKRPCPDLVADAARLLAERLNAREACGS